jgi:hypothetical protein
MTPSATLATATAATTPADFALEGCYGHLLLTPLSRAAFAWCKACLADDLRWLNGSAVVHPRLVDTIVEGITVSGLRLATTWKH